MQDWGSETARREIARKTSGNKEQRNETLWWNEYVQERIKTKKLTKITLDKDNNE